AAASDVALPLVGSAVVVEGSQTGECCGLFAADASELRHADDESERGALSDAGNAEHEIEAVGEVVMDAQLSDDAQDLGCATGLEPCNVGEDDALHSSVVDMLKPGLEPRDVFFDLLDEGQVVGELRQALVRLDARLIDGESAGGDENR